MIQQVRKVIEWSPDAGAEIRECILEAKSKALGSSEVVFRFNGVTVRVCSDSDEVLIYRDWQRAISGYLGKEATVGPYPASELTAQELADDARIEAGNERRRQAARAEYREKERRERKTFAVAIADAPALDIANPELWKSWVDANQSSYGARCVTFAEEWGRLMQARLAAGDTLAECAMPCSHVANYDGITGFMWGCARSMLAQAWRHGDELAKLEL